MSVVIIHVMLFAIVNVFFILARTVVVPQVMDLVLVVVVGVDPVFIGLSVSIVAVTVPSL